MDDRKNVSERNGKARLHRFLCGRLPEYRVQRHPLQPEDRWEIAVYLNGKCIGSAVHHRRNEATNLAAAAALRSLRQEEGQVKKLINRTNAERGRTVERAALASLREDGVQLPSWMQGADQATAEQDAGGIDLVIRSDVGDLYLQLKSSIGGARKFEEHGRRRRRIEIVVVHDTADSAAIRRSILAAAERLRNEFLRKRPASSDP